MRFDHVQETDKQNEGGYPMEYSEGYPMEYSGYPMEYSEMLLEAMLRNVDRPREQQGDAPSTLFLVFDRTAQGKAHRHAL